jgi:hypothetical protein
MFGTRIIEKIKTHISCQKVVFPRKQCLFLDRVKKYCTGRQVTDNSITPRIIVTICKQESLGILQTNTLNI